MELENVADKAMANVIGWSKHTPYRQGPGPVGNGIQYLFRFDNGYGASLINHSGSYGNEIAVIVWDGENYHLTYETPITNDVLGWLTPAEIESTLDAIAALPSVTPAISN